ncbi:hypothetical protein J5X84_19930 [Streptosporangiaceae bacterium NEAU-GS5]|nr:hypothetical protein [Streptosporangiaceae bacterium NEAU-GS5]
MGPRRLVPFIGEDTINRNRTLRGLRTALITVFIGLSAAGPAAASPHPLAETVDTHASWASARSTSRLATTSGHVIAHYTSATTDRVEVIGTLSDVDPSVGKDCVYARIRWHEIGGGWGASGPWLLCRPAASIPIHLIRHDVDMLRLDLCRLARHAQDPADCLTPIDVFG